MLLEVFEDFGQRRIWVGAYNAFFTALSMPCDPLTSTFSLLSCSFFSEGSYWQMGHFEKMDTNISEVVWWLLQISKPEQSFMKFQHLPCGRRCRVPKSRLSCYKYLFVPISARFLWHSHTIGGVSHLCNIQCVIFLHNHVIFDMQHLHYNRFTCTNMHYVMQKFWFSVLSTAFELLLV